MQDLTRLVTESLVRHGFDRPLDYRRLQWSRWFRCESHHSLLLVPSKPGVFALAEEIMDVKSGHVVTGASPVPRSEASGPEVDPRRMLAVTQFFSDDDMAFVLDRMFSRNHPMRQRLESGNYFVRFVVIEDQAQRQSICNALNQWIANSAEKATGIGSHFATSLELTPQTEYVANEAQQVLFDDGRVETGHVATGASPVPRCEASGPGTSPEFSAQSFPATTPQQAPGAATNINCPAPFPSGF
ncbi:MAG TPA: hypothetical protein VMH04_13130 [Candidatus Solibacter sp.]|nr:hypothetical protein [Candidatus Solibacter sp.]